MGTARRSPDHRETARSACSLAMALIQGRSVTPMDFERAYRADPAPNGEPRPAETRRRAFRNACEYLEACGFVLENDPSRRGAVRLDRQATLAPVRALAELDREGEVLEDLAHLLVALADAFEGVSAVEAHGAAAKLLRDFALNGMRRELAPASTKDQRTLRDAMADGTVVQVAYRREDGSEILRTLEPIRHVHVEGQDFLVALDRRDGRAKTFHYERFSKVRATDERFEPKALDLSRVFNPPFGYVIEHGPEARSVPSEVTFRVPAGRETAVRAELERLLCSGCGEWGDACDCDDEGEMAEIDSVSETEIYGMEAGGTEAGDRVWTVHGEDPDRAAAFALRLGIEVLSPAPYREAYLEAIDASRRAFGLPERTERTERSDLERGGAR